MGAHFAGTVQEAHHGAVRWGKSGAGAASHTCGPTLPVGVPFQTMSSWSCSIVTVLLLISKRMLLPSTSEPEVTGRTASPCSELKTCKLFSKRRPHSPGEASSSGTGPTQDISTHVTCRESTCTWTEQLLDMRTHGKLEKTALKETIGRNRAVTEMKGRLGSPVTLRLDSGTSPVARWWPPEARDYFNVEGAARTLRAWTPWTRRNAFSYLRVRLKLSRPWWDLFL